jgi:hypothetical protein
MEEREPRLTAVVTVAAAPVGAAAAVEQSSWRPFRLK